MKDKKIEIEIPFSGFYESIHSYIIDSALESYCEYYDIDTENIYNSDIDWAKLEKDYAIEYAKLFSDFIGLDIDFSEMISPKQYNYSSDRLFGTVKLKDFNKIRKIVYSHNDWANYIKNNYTSYDGFISFYDNDIKSNDWAKDILDVCQIESVLKFYTKNCITGTIESFYEIESEIGYDIEIGSLEGYDLAISEIEKYMKESKERA